MLSDFIEVPLAAIDEPMVTTAVMMGERIGAIATTKAAIPVVERQLLNKARKQGKTITLQKEFLKDASAFLRNGDDTKHDEMIGQAIVNLLNNHCDVVVLAQVSMARAKEKLLVLHPEIFSDQILTSLKSGVESAVKMTEEALYGKDNSDRLCCR